MRNKKKLNTFLATLLVAGTLEVSCNANPSAIDSESDKSSAADGVYAISPTSDMTVPRSGHTATLLPNGQVLITGGMERNGVFYSSTEFYVQATGKFTAAPQSMSTQRVGHTATLLLNGKVLIVGGWGANGVLATAELFDPATSMFTPTGSMSVARGDDTATLLPNGKVLVAGGENDSALLSAEVYDPATGTFSQTGNMGAERTMHTATLLPDGRVLIAGGGKYQHPLATAEIYSSETGTFTITGSMTVPRYKHAAMLLRGGNVLVVGGSDDRDWRGRYVNAEIYNPTRGSFTATGNMNKARFKIPGAVALLKNGKVLIAGSGEQVESYDSETRAFSTATGRMDAERFYSTATLLPDGRVLIAGGYNNHGIASAKAWLYKP